MEQQRPADQASQTRDRILATAERLFSTHGYEHTPLSHVAREAKVSKALVLWHFASKEELFRAALGRTLEPYFIDVDGLESLDEGKQLERLIDLFYEFVRDNGFSVRFLFGLMLQAERKPDDVTGRLSDLYALFGGLLANVIARGRDRGTLRADVDPQLDAGLIVATLGGILIEQFMNDRDSAELLAHLKRTTVQRLIK